MKLSEAVVFAIEQGIEKLLENLHEDFHEDRVTYIEAARILEELSVPYLAELHENTGATDGR